MRQHRTEPTAIEAEIGRLRSLAFDALRRQWRVVFGRTPPAALSKDLLGRMIAWRMQEHAFGGLDRESLSFLEGLARHGGSARRQLKPDTVLVREYRGERHTVTVAPDGFDWQGATYPSLSAVARAITGTAWSGPRFFGLVRPNGTTLRAAIKVCVAAAMALGALQDREQTFNHSCAHELPAAVRFRGVGACVTAATTNWRPRGPIHTPVLAMIRPLCVLGISVA